MMKSMDQIINLINELNKASELYYNGKESFLTDAEFDKKLEELKALEEEMSFIYPDSPTINVGAAPMLNSLNVVEIQGRPMLSLDKVHSAKEILNFYDGYDMAVSVKCDGLSVRLIYENGKLISANTRGNGTQGNDITEHVKYFLNIPRTIEKKKRYVIDGEAVILDSDFAIVNKNGEYKNSRNLAAGSLALLDMSIVASRRLSFIAWDIIEGGKFDEFHYNLEEAKELGFKVVPMLILDSTKVAEEEIDKLNVEMLNIAKEEGIPADGVVWKINDLKAGAAKGRTQHHWRDAIAWKKQDEEYETELVNIELSLGRTGVLTPVAIVKPVDIDGSTCSRCSLHNISVMKETLGEAPYIGQKVWIYKANMILPQIRRAEKGKGIPIFNRETKILCPACGEPINFLTSVDTGVMNAICENPQCSGKLINRLDHYLGIKGLNVKGISKATLEKLIGWGYIKEMKDIYELEKYRTEWESKSGFGRASVSKILEAIDTTGRRPQLDSFIAAIGIPLVGKAVAGSICKYYASWTDFRAAVGGDWESLDGFGTEMSKAINNFDYTEADYIVEHYISFEEVKKIKEEKNSSLEGKVFVVTGKLKSFKNRDELKDSIESLGGKVTGSVSAKTDYLINNDIESTSAKNRRAKEIGVPIITESDYLVMIGEL